MKPRLAIHTHEFYPKRGGIGTYCREIALGAAESGWDVTVYGPTHAERPANEPPQSYQLRPGRHGSSHGAINLWRSRADLAAAFRDTPAALHLLAEPGPILAYGLLRQSMPKPRVRLTLHGSEVERWAHSRTGVRKIAARSFQQAEQIILPSEAVADRLTAAFPSTGRKTKVVPHALPSLFRRAAKANTEHSVNTGSMRLLSVGRMHPRKGFDQILRALSRLPPSLSAAFQYTVAGARCRPSYERELRNLAGETGCPVTFLLDPDDATLVDCYRTADLFALTSLPHGRSVEGFGLVYLEAAAFGLPSLAYETGGVKEVVRNGETGILVPTGQIDLLASALQSFYQNRVSFQKMGLRAQESALTRNWRDVAEASLEPTGMELPD